MRSLSKSKVLIAIIIIASLLRIIGGLIILKEIPKTYGWYRIAENVLAGEKTLLKAFYSLDHGKNVLTANYYLVRPPIYILVYVMLIYYFKGSLLSYLIFHAIITAISIVIAYFIFNKILSTKVALLGSGMVAFYPYFITRVWNATEDNLYILFILVSFYLIFKFLDSKKIKFLIFSGVAMGLSYLIRSTILFFVALLIPLILILVKKNKLVCVIVLILSFILPLTPWLFYGHSIYGQLVMADHNGSRIWVSNNKYVLKLYPKTSIDYIEGKMWNDLTHEDILLLSKKTQLEREQILLGKAKTFALRHPFLFIRSGIKKAFSSLSLKYNPESNNKNMKLRNVFHFMFYLPLLLLGISGIVVYGCRFPTQTLVFLTYFISLLVMSFILWAHTRHTIPYHLTYIYGFLILIESNINRWPFKCLNK